MNLNVDDFISCFKEALAECGEDPGIADQFYEPDRIFTFNFDEPSLGPTVFDGISSNGVQLDKEADDYQYQLGVALAKWFRENQNVCEQTLEIAKRLLRAQKAKNQALTEEPEVITGDMYPLWSIFRKKPEKKPVQSHTIISADPNQQTLLHITPADFYTSMTRALAESNDKTVEVDSWLHTDVLYTFAFGQAALSDVPRPATFKAITSTTGGQDDHIIDAKWFSLHNWFVEHPEVLQRIFEIVKEVVEERSRTEAALEEDGELIGREDMK